MDIAFWSNVMVGIISGILSGMLVWLLSIVVNEMITRPKIKFLNDWKRRKWVGRYEKKKRSIQIPQVNFSRGILSSSSMDIETNIDEVVSIGGNNFDFYGITIKNENDPNVIIHRRVAEITRTVLVMDDGQEIECRWWTRDYSEVDKLFAGDGFDIDDRRKINISSGTSEHLVIAFRPSDDSSYSLFDITSDVGNNFWNTDHSISDFPRYGKLNIFTSSSSTELKLEFVLSNDTKNDLIIREIRNFPDMIFFEE